MITASKVFVKIYVWIDPNIDAEAIIRSSVDHVLLPICRWVGDSVLRTAKVNSLMQTSRLRLRRSIHSFVVSFMKGGGH